MKQTYEELKRAARGRLILHVNKTKKNGKNPGAIHILKRK